MSSIYYKKLLNYNLAYYDDNTPMVAENTQFYTATGLHWSNSPLYSNLYNTTYEKNWEISDRLSFKISVTYSSGYYHCDGSVTFDGHTTSIRFDGGLNTKQRDFGIIVDDDISEAWCYFVGDNSRSDQATTSVQAFTCMPYDKQAFYSYIKSLPIITTSNGGGATHIAKRTGTLTSIGSSNISDVLIASGGGGGGLLVSDTDYSGKDAGGISGSGDNSGNQSTGYGFGQGESGSDVSGGGAGLYGGYKGTSSKGGGAGSGYIGNPAIYSKKMVGYDVPTSSDKATKTETVSISSETRIAEVPKIGDGWARIKFLRTLPDMDIVGTYLFDAPENRHNFKTCGKYQNGSYLGGNWGWDFSIYSNEGLLETLHRFEGCLYETGATVSIDTSNGIDITYTGFTIKPEAYFWGTGRPHVGLNWEQGSTPAGNYFCGGTSETYYPSRNDFDSLEAAYEWIRKSFRRINLVVDGVTIVSIHDV